MAGCKSLSLPIYNRELTCSSSKCNTEFSDDLVSSLSLQFDDESVNNVRNDLKIFWTSTAEEDVAKLVSNEQDKNKWKKIIKEKHEEALKDYIPKFQRKHKVMVGTAVIVYVFALFKITTVINNNLGKKGVVPIQEETMSRRDHMPQ